jgi:hypothetical protein
MELEGSGGAIHGLADRVRRAAGSDDVPNHVIRRIAYTLAGQSAAFVDVNLSESKMLLAGQVTVYTDRHLAVAALQGLTFRPDDDAGEVHLTVLSRRTLTAIDVAPMAGALNNVTAWRPDRSGYRDGGWPSNARVSLTYPAFDSPLVLPSRRSTENLDAFLPSLLDDLAASI